MNGEAAAQIATSWVTACDYDPNVEGHIWSAHRRHLQALLSEALPDFEIWAAYPTSEVDPGAETGGIAEVVGLAGIAMYRIALTTNSVGEAGGFQVVRYELADVRVSLLDGLEERPGLARVRRRGWVITSRTSGESFGLVSEEWLEGPNAGPPPVERLARAIANATGWSM